MILFGMIGTSVYPIIAAAVFLENSWGGGVFNRKINLGVGGSGFSLVGELDSPSWWIRATNGDL